ncbi:MAG: hydroxymethylbilane synthase [Bacillota bacterium]|jgi:hydroxymethylbilane synthase
MKKIKIGTRKSRLAVAQTQLMMTEIHRVVPDLDLEMVLITTGGDLIQDRPLDQIGGKGLFIREIEAALLTGMIDLAVHSMKDLPAQIAPGLKIAAVSKREDPRDALVSWGGATLEKLPSGAVVGTSSLRRSRQLLDLRADLKVAMLRGNVLTRLEKLARHQYDAIILAAAGLIRLGLADRITQYFTVTEMIPAVCQGFLALETRVEDSYDFLQKAVHDEEAALCGAAERAFLIRLDGGCSIPIAAHATISGDRLQIRGMLAEKDSPVIYREEITSAASHGVELGERLADQIAAKSGGVL